MCFHSSSESVRHGFDLRERILRRDHGADRIVVGKEGVGNGADGRCAAEHVGDDLRSEDVRVGQGRRAEGRRGGLGMRRFRGLLRPVGNLRLQGNEMTRR